MGRRSRKESLSETGAQAPPKQRLSSAERDEIARAELLPLKPGERPLAVTISSVLAAALAVANVAFYFAGVEVQGQEPALIGVLLFAAVMLLAAWGMWTLRYWALLGFQALLAMTLVIAGLSLMVAGNLLAVILCIVILLGGGWLFWKLIRVLGRVKVPSLRGD
jgi:cation transport ATPase